MPDLSLSTWIWLVLAGVLSLLAFLVPSRFVLRSDEPAIEWLERHELPSGPSSQADILARLAIASVGAVVPTTATLTVPASLT
jgi:hypothetical protein